MIEIKKNPNNGLHQIYLNNKLIQDAEVWEIYHSKNRFHLKVPFDGSGKILLNSDLTQANKIDKFTVSGILPWLEKNYFESHVELEFYRTSPNLTDANLNLQCVFAIQPKSADWDLPFSINSYTDRFVGIWEYKFDEFCDVKTYAEPYDIALNVSFSVNDFSRPVIEEISKFESLIKSCHKETLILLSESHKESFVTVFDFPEELKISCGQYIVYFAQFLQDLGINSTLNLKEEAGKVLFSVTPTDDIEALDKICEALALYLNLPSSPIIYDDSFAAMRLKQQIDSLKHSQQMAETEFRLRMAQSLVEAQNKTIEDQSGMIVQQATFIQQQKEHIEKITNPAVMIKSAENKEELEELYEGVKVGESETLKKWLGISLNPAKAIKTAVKNTLGKESGGKSILGLDENASENK